MRILLIDPVCWPEHSTYNRYWIEVFRRKKIDFKAVLQSEYGVQLGLRPVDIEWEYPVERKCGFSYKLKLLYRIFRKVDVRQFDYVVFSVVDKQAFLLSPFFFFTRAIIVSHVWNQFSVGYKLFLRLLALRHHLVSIDPFIHKNLWRNKIPNTLIVHPSPDWIIGRKYLKEQNYFTAYVPGRNSNQEFIGLVMQEQTLKTWLSNNFIRLEIRCSNLTEGDDSLFFTNQFLLSQTYREKMEEADVIVIPYDSSFTNRISNVFFEAVALRKNILIKRNTHLDYYQEFDLQGIHIRFFTTLDEFKRQLLYFKTVPPVPEHFYDKLIDTFSIENMCMQFYQLIKESK